MPTRTQSCPISGTGHRYECRPIDCKLCPTRADACNLYYSLLRATYCYGETCGAYCTKRIDLATLTYIRKHLSCPRRTRLRYAHIPYDSATHQAKDRLFSVRRPLRKFARYWLTVILLTVYTTRFVGRDARPRLWEQCDRLAVWQIDWLVDRSGVGLVRAAVWCCARKRRAIDSWVMHANNDRTLKVIRRIFNKNWTSVSEGYGRISTHADPTSTRRTAHL